MVSIHLFFIILLFINGGILFPTLYAANSQVLFSRGSDVARERLIIQKPVTSEFHFVENTFKLSFLIVASRIVK